MIDSFIDWDRCGRLINQNRNRIFFGIIGILLSQLFIYFYAVSQVNTVQLSIQSLARREDFSANPYRFAQAIESLENLNIIRCTQIDSPIDGTRFFDSSFKGFCESDLIFLKGYSTQTDIKASSGQPWKVTTIVVFNRETKTMLWLIRFLLIVVALGFFRYLKWKLKEIELEKDKEIARKEGVFQIAKQVAHDIRSPLMAIEVALRDTDELPLNKRKLLEQAGSRIRVIADDLLAKSKGSRFDSTRAVNQREESPGDLKQSYFDLVPPILKILEEKRASYPLVPVDYDRPKTAIRVAGDTQDFERVFANLLQNAIDAVSEIEIPRIRVAVRSYSSKCQLSIIDNGKGIPTEVLTQVGTTGFSFGKSNGNGLGVSFAIGKMKAWGGDLQINSNTEHGTIVTLNFRNESKALSNLDNNISGFGK